MSSTQDSGTSSPSFTSFANKYAERILGGLTTSDFQKTLEKLSGLPTTKDKFIALYNQDTDKAGPYDFDKIQGLNDIISAYASISAHTADFQKVTLPKIVSLSKDIYGYLKNATATREDFQSEDPNVISKTMAARYKPEDVNKLMIRTWDLIGSIIGVLKTSLTDQENFESSYGKSSIYFDEELNGSLGPEIYLNRDDLSRFINITANLQAILVAIFSALQNTKHDIDLLLVKLKANQLDRIKLFFVVQERVMQLGVVIDIYDFNALDFTSKSS